MYIYIHIFFLCVFVASCCTLGPLTHQLGTKNYANGNSKKLSCESEVLHDLKRLELVAVTKRPEHKCI